MSISEQYVEAFAPWLTPDLQTYLEAIASMFAEVELYATDEDDDEAGWSILLDVDACPAAALPYLAQYVGERLPVGLSEADQRQWIKDAPNQERGTLSSIVKAAFRYLTGTKLVTVIERDGGPDKLSVITYTHQTPSADVVERELRTTVPADISLTYTVTAGQTWSQVAVGFASWDAAQAAYDSWADLGADTPDGTYSR